MVHHSFLFLAQAAQPAQGQPGAGQGITMLVYLLCFGVIFYFMIIRPQSQKQKQHAALVSAIKTGDKVVTSGGIHGMVANVKDATVILKVADNVKIEVDKASIGTVFKPSSS